MGSLIKGIEVEMSRRTGQLSCSLILFSVIQISEFVIHSGKIVKYTPRHFSSDAQSAIDAVPTMKMALSDPTSNSGLSHCSATCSGFINSPNSFDKCNFYRLFNDSHCALGFINITSLNIEQWEVPSKIFDTTLGETSVTLNIYQAASSFEKAEIQSVAGTTTTTTSPPP